MRTDDKRIYLALLLLYIAAVAFLCFMRPDDLPSVQKDFFGIPIDKVVHFIMFLPYPILSGLSFMHKDFSIRRNILILIVLTVTGIGLAFGTEAIQGQLGYRSYDIADFAADMKGMATGVLITLTFIIIQRIRK